jgi:hypothetical protein
VSDLLWDDVKQWFDPVENGTATDVIVANTTLADWQLLLDLIRLHEWACEYERGDLPAPVPDSAGKLFPGETVDHVHQLRVWPDPDLEWIIRPWAVEEILSDVDLHQIQGQERLDTFCRFLRTLGHALQKEVLVYSEGDNTRPPMLAYDAAADCVNFRAGSW